GSFLHGSTRPWFPARRSRPIHKGRAARRRFAVPFQPRLVDAKPQAAYLTALRMQHTLYFLPLPHGHGSLRPTFSARLRIGSDFLSPFWLLVSAACWSALG